ncbi:MAG: cyclase family protein [Candidatus Glassbacteria bacterium]|nr:cyclase family protein [Candidatus Glassbacteria bacterium]
MGKDRKRLIDLSHVVEHGMVTYRGIPPPLVSDFLTREESRAHYAPGTEFHIGMIEMAANTGTYLDSPFHRYADGRDLSQLELSSVAGLEGLVFRADAGSRPVGRELFGDTPLDGRAVLVHTGWDRHWGSEAYFEGHPFLTREAALHLAGCKAALVGIDSYNIDDTEDLARPAHSILLAAGIPVVEHMCNLGKLPASGFRFFAVPVKVKGLGSFPVRAFAVVGN